MLLGVVVRVPPEVLPPVPPVRCAAAVRQNNKVKADTRLMCLERVISVPLFRFPNFHPFGLNVTPFQPTWTRNSPGYNGTRRLQLRTTELLRKIHTPN